MRGLLAVLACMFVWSGAALAQGGSPVKFLSLATNNATLVKAGPVTVLVVAPVNTTATVYFLKLYDKSTAPVCGTDIPKWTLPLPATSKEPISTDGLLFSLGFGFCLVGGIADSDNSAAAIGVALNFSISGR
jgi:hypothetical protein